MQHFWGYRQFSFLFLFFFVFWQDDGLQTRKITRWDNLYRASEMQEQNLTTKHTNYYLQENCLNQSDSFLIRF